MGQNWFGIARLGTPLQQTAVQRGPLPRWPQLSRVAWVRENISVFQVINRRCPATLIIGLAKQFNIFVFYNSPMGDFILFNMLSTCIQYVVVFQPVQRKINKIRTDLNLSIRQKVWVETLAVGTEALHVIQGFPNGVT